MSDPSKFGLKLQVYLSPERLRYARHRPKRGPAIEAAAPLIQLPAAHDHRTGAVVPHHKASASGSSVEMSSASPPAEGGGSTCSVNATTSDWSACRVTEEMTGGAKSEASYVGRPKASYRMRSSSLPASSSTPMTDPTRCGGFGEPSKTSAPSGMSVSS